MRRVRAVMLFLASILATATVADATPDEAPATAPAPAHAQVDDDAARYGEREGSADEQLAFRGSQGAQYTQAAGIVGGTVLAVLLVAVIIIVVVVAT